MAPISRMSHSHVAELDGSAPMLPIHVVSDLPSNILRNKNKLNLAPTKNKLKLLFNKKQVGTFIWTNSRGY